LTKIIEHAVTTTDFYRQFSKNIPLERLPVVNKDVIRRQQHKFLSSTYNKNQLITMRTSGSTGMPFVSYQDLAKKCRVHGEVIYYSEKAGYAVGKNLVYLRALTEHNRKSRLKQWLQNQTLIDITNLTDNKIEEVFSALRRVTKSGSMLLSYASTFDVICDYFRRNGHAIAEGTNITGIVSSSEMLFDTTRESIEKAFSCRVFSRYSNQENGIIGQDDSENNVFILNEANYFVEILDFDADVPVPNGTVGRIVLTDLYNKAMPLIRYDTGDIGCLTYVNRNGTRKKAISSFAGRKMDIIYDTSGGRISAYAIANHFWAFPEIRQYQFIQETPVQYRIKLNLRDRFKREQEMTNMLKEFLGKDAVLIFERVDEIPALSSGKRKYVVNGMRS